MKKVKEQHYITEINNNVLCKLISSEMHLVETLFDDGSTELWLIVREDYDVNNEGISYTTYYKGYDTICLYNWETGEITEKKIDFIKKDGRIFKYRV